MTLDSCAKGSLARFITIALFLGWALLLSRCSLASPQAEVSPSPIFPSPALPPTVTPQNPSPTPTATSTPAATPTPLPTSTPTPFPTPIISDRAILRGNPDRPYVALTFDVEATRAATIPILDTLRQYGVPATFFVTGGFARKHPDIVRRMAQEGHQIGNHTNTHPYLIDLSDEEILDQLRQAETTLTEISGHSPRPYFRPPFAKYNARIRQLAAQEGYLTVLWTVDVTDWHGENTAESMVERALDGTRNGAIIVLHLEEKALHALPQIIEGLRERGYKWVSLNQLLAP